MQTPEILPPFENRVGAFDFSESTGFFTHTGFGYRAMSANTPQPRYSRVYMA